MNLGSALHRMIEAYLLGESPEDVLTAWADEVSPDWKNFATATIEDEENDIAFSLDGLIGAQIADVVQRATALLPGIIQELAGKWMVCFDRDGLPMIEYPISYRLDDGVHFHGVVDAVLLEKATGLTWVVDFKTKEYIQTEPEDDFETQTQLYGFVLRQMGVPIVGSIIYQISTKVPKIPKTNKDGSMSKTDIHTTWEIYERTLLENGLDPQNYQGMREKLSRKKFFQQVRTYRSPETLAKAWSEFIEGVNFMLEAQEIFATRQFRGEGTAPRNMNNFSCPRCQYKLFCTAEYIGGDASHLLGHMFEKGEGHGS
jgi:hypothetical protein